MRSVTTMVLVGFAVAMLSTSFLQNSYFQEIKAQGQWSNELVCVNSEGNVVDNSACLGSGGAASAHFECRPVNPGGQVVNPTPPGGPGSQQCN